MKCRVWTIWHRLRNTHQENASDAERARELSNTKKAAFDLVNLCLSQKHDRMTKLMEDKMSIMVYKENIWPLTKLCDLRDEISVIDDRLQEIKRLQVII